MTRDGAAHALRLLRPTGLRTANGVETPGLPLARKAAIAADIPTWSACVTISDI
jgi:hypothetical protein